MTQSHEAQQLQKGELTEKAKAELDRWVARFPEYGKQSAIIPALRYIQEYAGGWLSRELIDAVADYLEVPPIKAYEVATFYNMYDLEPVGQHKIAVCTNLPCQLAGSGRIVDHIKRRLNIDVDESTEDGRYVLKTVECMAACAGAPMLQIDDRQYHENLTIERVDHLLDEIDQQEQANDGE